MLAYREPINPDMYIDRDKENVFAMTSFKVSGLFQLWHEKTNNVDVHHKKARISLGKGGSRGGDRGSRPPENKKNGVSKQYWPESPENHKATKPAFIGPPAKRHLNCVSLAGR